MGQALVKNYLHIIFSTKNRTPYIQPSMSNDVYQYLGGICKNLECQPIKIGGYRDHIHILSMLSKNIALTELIGKLKSNSSKWIKTIDNCNANFCWQNGYGTFSVTPSEIDKVIEYISRQEEHHHHKTFQEEYREFLKRYEVEYDERYVWD